MTILTWLSLAITFFLLALLPFVFSELMVASLAKLHLDPGTAASIAVVIMLGGLINIAIARIPLEEEILIHPLAVFGLSALWPEIRRVRRETIIAVNVGGCLIPTGLALYELFHLVVVAPSTLSAVGIASIVAIVICYLTARPTPGVGLRFRDWSPLSWRLVPRSSWLQNRRGARRLHCWRRGPAHWG